MTTDDAYRRVVEAYAKKKGFNVVVYSTLPENGVWIGEEFYLKENIIKAILRKVKNDSNIRSKWFKSLD